VKFQQSLEKKSWTKARNLSFFRGVNRYLGIGVSYVAMLAAEASPRLDFALGVLAESRGAGDEAALRFENARAEDPMAFPLVERVAGMRLAAGDRAGAVKLYRDLAQARLDDLEIQIAYADFLEAQGRGDALALKLSSQTLEAALTKFPGDPRVVRRLFQHAQARGDQAGQESLLDQLSADDPAAVLLYASLFKSVFDSGDAAALGQLDKRLLHAFESNSSVPELARAASDHFRDTERRVRAIEILKRHAETTPASLDLRTRLGILYFEAEMNPEGEATLKDVLVIHPRHALAHQALAKFYRSCEKPELARFHASELLKIRGGSPADFLKLADEWLAADEPRQARLLLEKAVFNYPDNPDLARKLAIATRRDPATSGLAARLFAEAEAIHTSTDPPEPAFLVEVAEALIAQGQNQAAEERLRSAIKAFPPSAKKETSSALRRLALLWESENRNLDAARALRQRADALDR
jgi:Flp pilus assembly protein TadD